MMLFKRVGAELMGMYFKFTRIQLRCEVVSVMLFNLVATELMWMCFKSTRIQLRCGIVFMMLFSWVRAELMGMYSNPIELNYAVELFL